MSSVQIMTLGEIQVSLADRRLLKIKEATGVSYTTLKKLADGEDNNFTLGTLKKVSDYLQQNTPPCPKT